jgi:hypothetical protein
MMQPKLNRLIRSQILKQNPDLTPNPNLIQYQYTTNFLENLIQKHNQICLQHQNIPNLSPSESSTLKALKKDPNLVIKPVDKNLGIAVIDKSIYIQMAQTHLSDTTTYQKLQSNTLTQTIQSINSTLTQLHQKNLISQTTLKKLTAKGNTTQGAFYILPKLHKNTLESRPIVSNVTHPTKKISKFLHQTLVNTADSAKSHIKNSGDLIQHLKTITTTPTTFLITADIKSLYTMIPNQDGISTVVREMSQNPKNKLPPQVLGTLLNLTLTNNIFSFGDQPYLQINGTAMGTIMAPTYANVYLKNKEEALLLNPDLNPHLKNLQLYKRYVDDILCAYDNHDNSLPQFIKVLKKTYEPLTLTINIGREDIVFLDLKLTLIQNPSLISHQLYQKPLSNKTYIPPSSQHPPHMLRNIIYNDLLRANRLCNQEEQRNKHELNIMSKAIRAGYTKKELLELRNKSRRKAKTTPETAATLTHKTIMPLTYNGPTTEKLATATYNYWKTTANPSETLMIAYRTNANIKKLTVRSKFNTRTKN